MSERKQPLFLITGASGVGKSALCRELASGRTDYIVLESDLLWDEIYNTPGDGYRRYRETWMTLCAAISQAGRPVVLCGCGIPEQFEVCDARGLFTAVHTLALVCRPAVLEDRLRRGREIGDDAWVRDSLRFNAWLTENAPHTAPPMTRLDISGLSPRNAAREADRWIRSHFCPEV